MKNIKNFTLSFNLIFWPLISELDVDSKEDTSKNDSKRGNDGESNVNSNIDSGIFYSNDGSIPWRLIANPINLSTSRVAASVTLLQVQRSCYTTVLSNTLLSHTFGQATFGYSSLLAQLYSLVSV